MLKWCDTERGSNNTGGFDGDLFLKGLVGRELSDIQLLVELIIIIINGKSYVLFKTFFKI